MNAGRLARVERGGLYSNFLNFIFSLINICRPFILILRVRRYLNCSTKIFKPYELYLELLAELVSVTIIVRTLLYETERSFRIAGEQEKR